MSIQAHAFVVLRSINPCDKKPDFASIGGFESTINKVGVIFDWLTSSGNANFTEDGYLEMAWELRSFDDELFESSNEQRPLPTLEEIFKGDLTEVYYEVGYLDKNKEETPLEMELVSFQAVTLPKHGDKEETYSFSEDQVKDFKKIIEKERGIEMVRVKL